LVDGYIWTGRRYDKKLKPNIAANFLSSPSSRLQPSVRFAQIPVIARGRAEWVKSTEAV
jgi:hypothetical protein